jgi:hypothetical protein
VLVVAPTPGRGGEGIARDVLRAMGKRFDLPRTPRDPATLLARADLWLRASRITTLVVRHADRLAANTWRPPGTSTACSSWTKPYSSNTSADHGTSGVPANDGIERVATARAGCRPSS